MKKQEKKPTAKSAPHQKKQKPAPTTQSMPQQENQSPGPTAKPKPQKEAQNPGPTTAKEGQNQKRIKLFYRNFSCSEHDHDQDPHSPSLPEKNIELWEAETYRYGFNPSIFIKSLFLFLLDATGLGFITFLYDLIFRPNFIRNFYALGFINNALNKLGLINTAFLIYCLWQGDFVYTNANSLGYIAKVVYFSVMGAALNSFLNPKIPLLMSQAKFSKESLENTDAFFHNKDEFKGDVEFKRTVLRLNYDASSFFMTFFETDGNTKFKRQLQTKNQADIKDERDNLVQVLPEGFSKDNLPFAFAFFEHCIFNYKFLRKPSRFDENKAYGYTFAQEILKNKPKKSRGFYSIAVFAVIGLIALNCLRLDASKHESDSFIQKYIVHGDLLLLNIAVTIGILNVVFKGADVLWTRLENVKGMAELISEKEPTKNSIFRKDCSMINVLDPESLRTWAGLRMIFMNMYQRRLDSISFAISLIVAIQAIILTTLGFFYVTTPDAAQKDFFFQYLIFFGAPAVFYMTFVLLFIYVGSKVNQQYQAHIYLLKKLKTAIVKLYALYPNFTGENSVQPTTYLYARGVRYLTQSFGDQEVTQQLLDERLKKISDAYDEVMTDLENDEKHHPLRILGIPMTKSLVGTIFGFILTAVMNFVRRFITKILSSGMRG